MRVAGVTAPRRLPDEPTTFAVELTGSTPVEAREERCRCHGQDECRFYARWE